MDSYLVMIFLIDQGRNVMDFVSRGPLFRFEEIV